MVRLISGTMPKVEQVGGFYLTSIENEEGLYTRDLPEVEEKQVTCVTYRDTAYAEREFRRVPEEATEQEFVFHPESGLWEYRWTWYEVHCA